MRVWKFGLENELVGRKLSFVFFIYNFFFLSCLLLLYLACTLPVLQVYRAQRLRTPGRCENGRASVETAVTWSESSEPPAREKDKREYCGEKNLIKNWREKNRFEKSIGKWKLPKQGFCENSITAIRWGLRILRAGGNKSTGHEARKNL